MEIAFLICLAYLVDAEPGSMMIMTQNGLVRGKKMDYSDRTMDAYLGIPYAKPPLGKLRFKHPVPVESWRNILEADKFPKACVQREIPLLKFWDEFNQILPSTELSEDCLYLNVYVPRSVRNGSDVLVFIHGGGFSGGSNSAPIYDPFVLSMEENLITVAMNYRLASIGFLHLNHPDFEPNRGLMDQLLALKWVKDNIALFGGDPGKVTIMGNSAGGMSVSLHMLSPLSRGLFRRAIMDSGVALTDWAISSHRDAAKNTFRLAQKLNCTQRDMNSVAICLQETDPKVLVENEPIEKYYYFVFRPIVDGHFITEHPVQAFKNNKKMAKLDILLGLTSNESTVFLSAFLPRVFIPFADKIYPKHSHLMQIIDILFEYESDMVKSVMLKQYTDLTRMEDGKATLDSGERMLNDYAFTCSTNNFAKWYASMGSNVYSYYFNYRSNVNRYAKWLGVVHGESMRYSLGEVIGEAYRPAKDIAFSRRVMRYYANFIRTGDPNYGESDRDWINWPKLAAADNRSSLVLSPGVHLLRDSSQDDKSCRFWDDTIYELREAFESIE